MVAMLTLVGVVAWAVLYRRAFRPQADEQPQASAQGK